LGAGMKATAFYGIDPRGMINNSKNVLGRHEMYIGLSGGFGSVKLGSPNTAALSANGAGQVFGTATGGGYANIMTASGSAVRFDNSVRYDTPAFSGFSASVNYAPGNNDATAQTQTAVSAAKVTDIGLAYANGPLNVNYSNLKRGANAASTAAAQAAGHTGIAATVATAASTYSSLGANYTIGAVKLLAGYGKGTKSGVDGTTVDVNSKLSTMGVSYTFGQNTILAAKTQTKLGTAAAREAVGVRFDRELSKRTVAYAVYEAYDSGAATANKTNTAAVGVRHSF
jgi:predicted porin